MVNLVCPATSRMNNMNCISVESSSFTDVDESKVQLMRRMLLEMAEIEFVEKNMNVVEIRYSAILLTDCLHIAQSFFLALFS